MTSARGIFALSTAVALASCQTTPPVADFADLLIMGGTLHDGSGADGRSASVLVDDGKIVRIVSVNEPLPFARKVIDARGFVIAPGFIDPHTHAGSDLASDDAKRRANLAFAFQGVTTVVVGNDGFGAPDIAAQAIAARENGIGTNVAYLAGFGPIRETVIGDANRAPTDAEIDEMRTVTRQAMCEGAWGLSTGLYYVPQNYAATDEVTELAKEVSALGGYYDTHMRDESTYNITVEGALAETLQIGRGAQIPVHIAHIKALGPAVWGHSAQMIAMIEAARAAGQRVTADQYPWEASGTRVSNALVPRWALEGGLDALRERLRDPGQAARIREGIAKAYERRGGAGCLLITGPLHGAEVSVGGTLAEIAKKQAIDPVDAAISILMEGDARVASFNMSAADIAKFAAQDWVVTGSDGSTGHPRKYGSFPKAYQDLVNGDVRMSMARFVQRSSAQTADIIGLTDRGRIAAGLAADVVVFDPDEFAPRATYQSPRELSVGVRHLLINGELVVSDGEYTGALPGLPLLKEASC
ncbi:N-acyl-D-amino-acid deacylase family protein [Altererythrobacter ishigakiensis]|uniref:N-acyl-D-aspartate/D-glutamate deacylase n=1 Tax=Altererythrobacter ishigakiensis TaxID=476157 RepID=A0A562UM66_9SPHN|nr:amidohydrolase family protein [Altererythrobacter ishigakiensis]TWJ06707.1 N-acyl-D-aspartate/D-glutamate deacylase [Altererythrobacter ishigakiensis]